MTINKQPPSKDSDKILEELSKNAVDERFIRHEEELFQHHVSTLTSFLKSDVARVLKTEPAQELSKEFVDTAQAFLKEIRNESSIQNEKRHDAFDEDEIVHTVRKEIAEALSKGIVPPDEQEITSHANELAQCVLSNWFALLQKAKHLRADYTHPIPLNSDAIPFNAFATGLLFDGVEAFALDLNTVERRFEEFLMSLSKRSWLQRQVQQARAFLTRNPHYKLVELAPDLVLIAERQGRWFLTKSVSEATKFIHEWSIRESNYVTLDLSQFDPDWVISGVCVLEWPRCNLRWDRQVLRDVIKMAANNAIRQQRESSQLVHYNFDRSRTAEYQRLLEQVTSLTSKSIQQSLYFGHNPKSAEIFRNIREQVSHIRVTLESGSAFPNESTMEICQAVIASATFAVAKCAGIKVTTEDRTEELQDHIVSNQPDGRIVLDIATRTATDVLNSPEIQASLRFLRSSYKGITVE